MLALVEETARRIPSLPGHSIFVLLIQIALLLVTARLGGELAKRISLPSVVGELAAGIMLGPTVFGHYFPDAFYVVFPAEAAQFHLLETVSTLGMVFLLMLTGLETDVRLLRNLGRPALWASLFGMVVPFGMGFGLGVLMPTEYVAEPGRQILFSFFLATAMSISAMPVIAKILMDLDLTKRNIGLVILSAGVVDDTTGWIILSVIAGAASTGSADVTMLATTIGWTAVFCVGMVVLGYPLLRWLFKVVSDNFKSKDTDLVLMAVATLTCAAATERIGVHAVFGAFIVGVIMRQVPRVRPETVHKLEAITMSILAPVFFGVVGLKVNLWTLNGAGMFFIVLGVATVSKLVGCTVGARLGGLGFWESLSIAVAMNARGAMELVVASIGLSLGILNLEMFSIIVLVAIVTSFMAPIGLRLTMSRVTITDDERERMMAAESKGFFDAGKLRVLIPTAGGPHAALAAKMGFALTKGSDSPLGILYVDSVTTWWERVVGTFRPKLAGRGIDQHLTTLKALSGSGTPPSVQKVAARHVVPAIVTEAQKGYDLVIMGASRFATGVKGDIVEDLVERSPCHIAVMKPIGATTGDFTRLLVPVDGSVFSRAAVDFAVLYVERTGAELTLLFLTERRPHARAYIDEVSTLGGVDDTGGFAVEDEHTPIEEVPGEMTLDRVSPVFKASKVKPTILSLSYHPTQSAVASEARSGKYDLIIVGAENRAVKNRLFFGYENERLLREAPVSVLLVVPKVGEQPRT